MTRWQKSILFICIVLALFSLARVALFIRYREIFSALSWDRLFFSAVNGARFDLSILLTAFAGMLVFFNFPVRLADSRIWQRIWGWGMYLVLILLSLILTGDIIYFSDVKRHITSELLVAGNDAGFIVGMAFGTYKFHLALFFLFAASLFFLWRLILDKETREIHYKPVKYILFAGFMFLGIRGTFSDKSINIIDAFESGDSVQSNLVLNGVFTLYHHARATKNGVNHQFFPSNEAETIANTPISITEGGKKHGSSSIIPKPPSDRSYNVVLILLESWSPFYIDSYGKNGFGVTPNFDRLTKSGLKFTNFYAVGQRSIEGIQASLTGIPPLIGLPNLGFGLEAINFPRIGNMLKDNGYETIFIQSSRRRSYRTDAIARATGFNQYYGMEDMPMLLDYGSQNSTFGWDYESLMFLKSKLDDVKKPFFAFLFTGTTHAAYIRPGNGLDKYPHGDNTENGFLNTLHYSDWSLGEFLKKAESAPWFDNTIFIFTADHNIMYRNLEVYEHFHIPFVIYAPKLFNGKEILTVGSQVDIAPTIIDMLGFNGNFPTYGASLFKKGDEFAYVSNKNAVGIITTDGFLFHSLGNRMESGSFNGGHSEEYLLRMEKKLLAIDQVMYEKIINNKLVKIENITDKTD